MIKNIRLKSNRTRAKAIKYTGKNASEIQSFLEVPVREEKNHEYLIIQGIKVLKNNWVVRNIMTNPETMDVWFDVMDTKLLKEKYNVKEN